jgi:hypothetical protein
MLTAIVEADLFAILKGANALQINFIPAKIAVI